MMGWQCPGCGACWSPFVTGCGNCNVPKTITSGNTLIMNPCPGCGKNPCSGQFSGCPLPPLPSTITLGSIVGSL